MSDDLLYYYEKELTYLRKSSESFSKQYPKVAGRLRISGDSVEDPHISRLIESVAFLNAKVQKKLDDDFPELTEGILNVIYPHYIRPLPSFNIARFNPNNELDSYFHIPVATSLETPSSKELSCRFQTCYPVDLWPITVTEAKIYPRPFITPGSGSARGSQSVLHLQLQANWNQESISELEIDQLKFYLHGQPQLTYPLYQFFLQHCTHLFVARHSQDENPIACSPTKIQPVGFEQDEGLYPYPEQSFTGYRLLTEFFAAPEKFLFFSIEELKDILSQGFEKEINFYFYFDSSHSLLEKSLTKDNILMNACPIINLFEQDAEPIKMEQTEYEYKVIPDVRYEKRMSIYSIEQVSSISPEGETHKYQPIYTLSHENDNDKHHLYWKGRRETNVGEDQTYLSIVDLNFDAETIDQHILRVRALCTNNDEPSKLPSGSGQPHLSCTKISPPVNNIESITPPSAILNPALGKNSRWKLISHLNLNYLSLSSSEESLKSLKELLRLYDFKDSPTTRAQIDSILSIKTEPMTAPIFVRGQTALCRGTQITIVFDEQLLVGSSIYLFASILERFFGLYCSVNSFTRLVAKIKGKEGVLKKWPPRAGVKALV